jgi:hypothetical protein
MLRDPTGVQELTGLVSTSNKTSIYPTDDSILSLRHARFRQGQPYTRLAPSSSTLVISSTYTTLKTTHNANTRRAHAPTTLPATTATATNPPFLPVCCYYLLVHALQEPTSGCHISVQPSATFEAVSLACSCSRWCSRFCHFPHLHTPRHSRVLWLTNLQRDHWLRLNLTQQLIINQVTNLSTSPTKPSKSLVSYKHFRSSSIHSATPNLLPLHPPQSILPTSNFILASRRVVLPVPRPLHSFSTSHASSPAYVMKSEIFTFSPNSSLALGSDWRMP